METISYKCDNPCCADSTPTRDGTFYWNHDLEIWVPNDDMEDPYCPQCGDLLKEILTITGN